MDWRMRQPGPRKRFFGGLDPWGWICAGLLIVDVVLLLNAARFLMGAAPRLLGAFRVALVAVGLAVGVPVTLIASQEAGGLTGLLGHFARNRRWQLAFGVITASLLLISVVAAWPGTRQVASQDPVSPQPVASPVIVSKPAQTPTAIAADATADVPSAPASPAQTDSPAPLLPSPTKPAPTAASPTATSVPPTATNAPPTVTAVPPTAPQPPSSPTVKAPGLDDALPTATVVPFTPTGTPTGTPTSTPAPTTQVQARIAEVLTEANDLLLQALASADEPPVALRGYYCDEAEWAKASRFLDQMARAYGSEIVTRYTVQDIHPPQQMPDGRWRLEQSETWTYTRGAGATTIERWRYSYYLRTSSNGGPEYCVDDYSARRLP